MILIVIKLTYSQCKCDLMQRQFLTVEHCIERVKSKVTGKNSEAYAVKCIKKITAHVTAAHVSLLSTCNTSIIVTQQCDSLNWHFKSSHSKVTAELYFFFFK